MRKYNDNNCIFMTTFFGDDVNVLYVSKRTKENRPAQSQVRIEKTVCVCLSVRARALIERGYAKRTEQVYKHCGQHREIGKRSTSHAPDSYFASLIGCRDGVFYDDRLTMAIVCRLRMYFGTDCIMACFNHRCREYEFDFVTITPEIIIQLLFNRSIIISKASNRVRQIELN